MKLLTSQKDYIYKYIVELGDFTPNQFELIEEEYMGNHTTKLKFRDSDYYFNFYESDEYQGFWLNYSPGQERVLESTGNINWQIGFDHFITWHGNLKRELNSPNLWERFNKEISTVAFANNFDTSKFSTKEFIELKSKIQLLNEEIKTIPLSEYQQNEIISNLNRLIELAEDLNKYDWKNLFIGTIISIIIQLSVTQDNATILWTLIKKVFNTYFIE